jgi:hypothetical protein
MKEENLALLINRSTVFQNSVARVIEEFTPAGEERFLLAFQSGLLSFEHSIAALQLVNCGLFASGYSLFRPQFESLVRGIWLLHAASDTWIEKLGQPLTETNAKKAQELPMLAGMLEELEKSTAPVHLITQLKEYKTTALKELNSYTHGGFHPLSRTISGYPEKLTFNALTNSNAVIAITAQLLAIASDYIDNMDAVRSIHVEFADCIPIIKT